jgi:universal stress protein A
MSAPKTLLCPIDFSEYAEAALYYALTSSLAANAYVQLLYVLPQINYYDLTFTGSIVLSPGAEELFEREKNEAEERCKTLAALLKDKHPDKTFAYEILQYADPGESIVKAAETHGTHLIVMGSHGRRGLNRMLMGSVAEYVLRHASCPVLVYKK